MRQRSSGVDAALSLAWVLEPLTVETFLDEIWANTHHHIQRDRPDYFDALLPGPSIADALLEAFRHEPSAVRMSRGKDKKGPDTYRLADGSLNLDGVRNDFAAGYTIVLDGVEQYVRSVGTLARALEVELNYPTQVNAYLTPPQSTGLIPHYDDHDVLILQLQGSKTWHLYRRRRPAATRDPARQGQSGRPCRSARARPTCDCRPATCCTCRVVAFTRPRRTQSPPSI